MSTIEETVQLASGEKLTVKLDLALSVTQPTPPTPEPPIPPTPGPDTKTLQQRIDAATAGSTLDLTGNSYSEGATIPKPLTLIGALVNPPAGGKGLIIASDGVTLRKNYIPGQQHSKYVAAEMGIVVQATAAKPIRGLVLDANEILNFGNTGLYLRNAVDPFVQGNIVHDCVYAGLMALSFIGGTIKLNVISHIGEANDAALQNNAYGIAVSRADGTDPLPSDVLVDSNDISDVPNWEAMDTHAGLRIRFIKNKVRHSRRALMLCTDKFGGYVTDVIVQGNQFTDPYSPNIGDVKGVVMQSVRGGNITGNTIQGYGAGRAIYDFQGASTGVVTSPNTIS